MATRKTEKKEIKGKTAARPAKAKAPAAKAPAKAKAPAAGKSEPKAPTYQMIAQRAYEIWEAKGWPEGSEAENWAQAERELRGRA